MSEIFGKTGRMPTEAERRGTAKCKPRSDEKENRDEKRTETKSVRVKSENWAILGLG